MANAKAADLHKKVQHMTQFGNGWSEDYGAVSASGVNQNEKVYLGVIPAGVRVQDVRLITSGTLGASTTVDLGYEPVDGSSPSADGDYWQANLASTSALNTTSSAAPITFEKDVFLVATVEGANVSGSPTMSAVAQGKCVGVK